jgi:DNA-binding protein HU-beta
MTRRGKKAARISERGACRWAQSAPGCEPACAEDLCIGATSIYVPASRCAKGLDMSKKFLKDAITQAVPEMTGVAATRLAGDIIEAIKAELLAEGRFALPGFGSFVVRETAKRTAMNPRTGEKVPVKAGATVRFKASPNLREEAFAALKKQKRKTTAKK